MTNLHADVVVVGAGHAGCEAALAAARLGAETVLFTINLDHTAQMSCNPAIGGIAKGQVVREVDALGGEMAWNTDAAVIQFRTLNKSKGPAVQSPRAQCDKLVYQRRMKHVIERQPNLRVHQARVVRFLAGDGVVHGVVTEFGEEWTCRSLVVATGTFLDAKLHYGLQTVPGGRAGDAAAVELARSCGDDLDLDIGRLKTGTPPRVLGRTLDTDALVRQDPDPDAMTFSFRQPPGDLPRLGGDLPQLPCFVTQSTPATADIIRRNMEQSPLYSGRIEGIGTRYCPSFEDKVVRFPDQETHQIYLEPEGVFTDEYYLNGISTSLPPAVQHAMVRSLPGLEHAHITRYAYAIEYDFVFPHQIDSTLAVKKWPNLFLAGQINGTSGYEEAAGQGLVAGVNAARHAGGTESAISLGREQAYIGVMIDDLVTKEIIEPYRLFTSRAEHRLLLRQDNADRRLVPLGYDIGLIDRGVYDRLQRLEEEIGRVKEILVQTRYQGSSLWEWLRRPEISYSDLADVPEASPRAIEQIEIEARYEGYIARQHAQAADMRRLDRWRVPRSFDYAQIRGLRKEAQAKLEKMRPATLAQAARIDGVTPAEIALLQVHLKREREAAAQG